MRGDVLRYLDARDAFKGSPKDKVRGMLESKRTNKQKKIVRGLPFPE